MKEDILKKINLNKVGFFRFKEIKNKRFLLTNDSGEFVILKENEFEKFLKGEISQDNDLYPILQEQGLIRDQLDFDDLISKYQKKNLFLWQGPSLHIIVLTLRCDHKCIYCQASSVPLDKKGFDLDIEKAKKIVDVIFKTPSKKIAIEFQGGEPLYNWQVLKFIVNYAEEKNKIEKKDLEIRLVSNLTQMTQEKLNFLIKNKITLSTSFDGPESLHNKNRVWDGGNSYKNTVKWLKIAQKYYKKELKNEFKPGAIVTVSRYSLKYPKQIVDEYIKNKIEALFVRPVTPLGMAKEKWEIVGYSSEEYLKFYKKLLDYVIKYNLENRRTRFHEAFAKIILAKIFTEYDPNYLELRSPCGAGIGQLLYNYDGKVYTCDEGRMVREDTFSLGNVLTDDYKKIISNPVLKTLTLSSCLDGLDYDFWVYKPYFGTCPIYNYVQSGNIFQPALKSERDKIHQGIIDFLFERMENKKIRAVFEKWASYTLPENKNNGK